MKRMVGISVRICIFLGLIKYTQPAFVWNTNGEASIFVALALPLDLPQKQVFLSYNFEAHYTLPKTWSKKPPVFRQGNDTHEYGPNEEHHHKHKHRKHKPSKNKKKIKKSKTKPKPQPVDDDRKDFFEDFPLNGDGEPISNTRPKRSLLSRSKFYEILSLRFEQHGFGTEDHCLLRLICESNSYNLAEVNGVLGSLVHLMFSPSSSRYEDLPQRYYLAELNGLRNNCAGYMKRCTRSLLDLITQPITN